MMITKIITKNAAAAKLTFSVELGTTQLKGKLCYLHLLVTKYTSSPSIEAILTKCCC